MKSEMTFSISSIEILYNHIMIGCNLQLMFLTEYECNVGI